MFFFLTQTQIVTKFKGSNFDKTKKNSEKTYKLKYNQNSKTQIVTKPKNSNGEKLKNSNCDETEIKIVREKKT